MCGWCGRFAWRCGMARRLAGGARGMYGTHRRGGTRVATHDTHAPTNKHTPALARTRARYGARASTHVHGRVLSPSPFSLSLWCRSEFPRARCALLPWPRACRKPAAGRRHVGARCTSAGSMILDETKCSCGVPASAEEFILKCANSRRCNDWQGARALHGTRARRGLANLSAQRLWATQFAPKSSLHPCF